MPRLPRELTVHENLSVHKVWRGHNREWNLSSESEKHKYTDLLREEIQKQSNLLTAACLMSNHVHEIYQLKQLKPFSDFMRRHHGRYGAYFNKKHDRRGKVAQDRPFVANIEAQDDVEMRICFYIHANPVRAKMVKDAKQYRWSTHRLYAFGLKENWMEKVVFPGWYLRLGRNMLERQRKYRKLFDAYLREEGMLKKAYSVYGIGGALWLDQRRQAVLNVLREFKASSSPP
ncbi:MAG: transposase [Bdellovibrionales bacterium]|nr:transposase [Bdellovibrionales bacterium]